MLPRDAPIPDCGGKRGTEPVPPVPNPLVGALWEMHETARGADGRYRIATFNPGSNANQVAGSGW